MSETLEIVVFGPKPSGKKPTKGLFGRREQVVAAKTAPDDTRDMCFLVARGRWKQDQDWAACMPIERRHTTPSTPEGHTLLKEAWAATWELFERTFPDSPDADGTMRHVLPQAKEEV